MGYSRSYVSKVESVGEHASREFATAADAALNAGGAIRRAWREQEEGTRSASGGRSVPVTPALGTEPSGGLLVEHDHAELHHDRGAYRATMRRKLVNNGGIRSRAI